VLTFVNINLKCNVIDNKMTSIEDIYVGPSTVAQMFKLPQHLIDYLWECIQTGKTNPICFKKNLAGNISQSYKLDDPQQLLMNEILNIIYDSGSNPKMTNFIDNETRHINKKLGGELSSLKLYIRELWVNFQKRGEFQPLHIHSGVLSFVIWMEIPYYPENESKIPFSKSNSPFSTLGTFSFAYSDGISRAVHPSFVKLSPSMNGYCCIFPSDLAHQVYPFYTSDKCRISISGNICLHSEKLPHQVGQSLFHTSET